MTRSSNPAAAWYCSNLFITGVLFLSTAFVYQEVPGYDFINLDDGEYVEFNDHVRTGVSIGNLWWALTSTEASNWHPLTWISLQVDAAISGPKAGGFHLTNLVLHLADTILLFLVLRKMTAAPWRSALVAALFGLHPAHVESVAWIAERKDVLSALGWVLAMSAYTLYVQQPRVDRYLLLIVVFALGLMAKPMLVTLPFILLLLDYWPLASTTGQPEQRLITIEPQAISRLVAGKLPLFVLSAAAATVTLCVQKSGGALKSMAEFPFPARLGNAASAYIEYIGELLWPAKLAVFYSHDPDRMLAWPMAACVLLLGGVLFAVWRVRERYLFVGWFWYLGTLLPVIGIVQVGLQRMADRYTYIPSIGLFIALVWGLADLCNRVRIPVWFRAMAAVGALAACAITARAQLRSWQNPTTLWEQALRADPNSAAAHRNLGVSLARQGKAEEAMRQYQQAIECDPYDAEAHFNLAVMRASQREWDQAAKEYHKAIEIRPDVAEWHHNLGVALLETGRANEAIEHFTKALELRPELTQTQRALAVAQEKQKPKRQGRK